MRLLIICLVIFLSIENGNAQDEKLSVRKKGEIFNNLIKHSRLDDALEFNLLEILHNNLEEFIAYDLESTFYDFFKAKGKEQAIDLDTFNVALRVFEIKFSRGGKFCLFTGEYYSEKKLTKREERRIMWNHLEMEEFYHTNKEFPSHLIESIDIDFDIKSPDSIFNIAYKIKATDLDQFLILNKTFIQK